MKPIKGYYSLIQYCPDLSRLEAANVGVLLFCPEINFLKARTDQSDSRVRKIFGLQANEKGRIASFRRAIEERLTIEQPYFQTVEDLQQFIDTRANVIQLTAPRPMKVFNPEHELEELFAQLVAEPEKKKQAVVEQESESLENQMELAFGREEIQRRILRDISVEVSALRSKIVVPFGFQNGHLNLIQPVRFEAKKRDKVIERACKYAIEGDSIAKQQHPLYGKMKLVVVGQFAHKQADIENDVCALLRKYYVRFFKEEEVSNLVKEIVATGKLLSE